MGDAEDNLDKVSPLVFERRGPLASGTGSKPREHNIHSTSMVAGSAYHFAEIAAIGDGYTMKQGLMDNSNPSKLQ